MEPRGGIEPPHVHGVVHGRRFRFCYCTRHICCLFQQSGTVFISPTSENVSLYSGTGGRLCSPNLRFWRPALSIELHPYIYRPQRRYAPGWVRLSGGLLPSLLFKAAMLLGPGAAWKVWPSRPSGLDTPAAYISLLSQALKVLLRYASAPPPDRLVLLLSRMPHVLSGSFRPAVRRGATPLCLVPARGNVAA